MAFVFSEGGVRDGAGIMAFMPAPIRLANDSADLSVRRQKPIAVSLRFRGFPLFARIDARVPLFVRHEG